MKDRHLKEMSMKDEIISPLKEKLANKRKNAGLYLGGGSSAPESMCRRRRFGEVIGLEEI